MTTDRPDPLDCGHVVVMEGVRYGYGRKIVLDEFSVKFSSGIVGLLGPNGAGKSTILRLIASVSRAQQGRIVTLGFDTASPAQLPALRRQLGYLPQDASWRESLRVSDFLYYFAWLRSIPRGDRKGAVQVALVDTQLENLRDRKIGALSGGEKRRVMLAQSLLHKPALLILDEPTSGLDPRQRHHFRTLLSALRPATATIISTHLLEDVANLADELVIVDGGRLLYQGTAKNLAALAGDETCSVAGMHAGFMHVLAGGTAPV